MKDNFLKILANYYVGAIFERFMLIMLTAKSFLEFKKKKWKHKHKMRKSLK